MLHPPIVLILASLFGSSLVLSCTESSETRQCQPLLGMADSLLDASESNADAGTPSLDAGVSTTEDAPGPTAANGNSSAAEIEISDDYVSDIAVEIHEEVNTMLVVTWTQTQGADESWLEFEFEGESTQRSRPKPGVAGEHRDVVLGVPEQTEITLRVVSSVASETSATHYQSSDHRATTGSLPARLPRPEILTYDPTRSSPERWLFGSVEDSPGGRDLGYYFSTFWLYIMDRQGRIVWYYADLGSNATSSFQRIARDGEYIWIEKRPFGGAGERGVLKMTLDWEYFEEIPVPGLSDCIDVTDDGSLLYDAFHELREMNAAGDVRTIWSCRDHFGPYFNCYSNTVNWRSDDDTVLLSFPVQNTVVEIDRQTGATVAQYGRAAGSFGFAPPASEPPDRWSFSFQHFPNFTADDTLLVSSHVPGCGEHEQPGEYRHAFLEFEVDRDRRRLIEKWRYIGREWPRAKGMAIRLANGNTLGNYGTGGVIREVTSGGDTVFHVKFDAERGSDFYNKMVGHNVYVDDLYALNGGPR